MRVISSFYFTIIHIYLIESFYTITKKCHNEYELKLILDPSAVSLGAGSIAGE
jgi:hypothetical protein